MKIKKEIGPIQATVTLFLLKTGGDVIERKLRVDAQTMSDALMDTARIVKDSANGADIAEVYRVEVAG